jgi:heat shock protein HslJ
MNETELAEHLHAAVAEVPARTTVDLDQAIAAGGRRARRRRGATLALSMLLIPVFLIGAFVTVRGADRPPGNGATVASANPTATVDTSTTFVGHTYVSVAWTSAGQPRLNYPDHAWITFDANRLLTGPGCSGIRGTYQIEGNRLLSQRILPTVCTDASGPAVMWLMSILQMEPTWRLDGDTLTLTGRGGSFTDTVTMVDERVAPMSVRLETMSWRLDTVIHNGVRAPLAQPGVPTPLLDIRYDGVVEVRFQCAELIAPAVLQDASLSLPRPNLPNTTLCPPAVAQLLSRLADLLAGSFAISMHGDRLTLTTASGSGVSGISAGPKGV